jgi:hypothetical protein
MKWKFRLLLPVSAALLLATVTAVVAQQRSAQVTLGQSTPTFSFGMIGLGTGATARLNVVNVVRTAPPIATAQVPCQAELDLYDGQGKLIKQKTIANLGYGAADFIDVSRSEIAASGTHVEVSGFVKVSSGQSFFCSISPTLEVFDSVTGVTSAILTNANTSPPLIFSTFSPGLEPTQR